MHIWFQNLADKDNDHKWPHFRGSFTASSAKHRLSEFSYELFCGWSSFGCGMTVGGGDSELALSGYLKFFFFKFFWEFPNFLKKPMKDYQGRDTQFYFFQDRFVFQVWAKEHEWSSDGSSHLVDWSFTWPWAWDHVNSEHKVLNKKGNWVPIATGWYMPHRSKFKTIEELDPPDNRWFGEYPYEYRLMNGTSQARKAIIFVERREWRWRGLKYLPYPRRRSQSIQINFNDEVGERSGSYKGGCIGCSFDMYINEDPERALRRMERTRIFK